MKKLLYITNIPTPYRQKRFNKMAEIFPEYGIDFEVLYMAKKEPNRNWTIPEDSYKYNYKIYKGIHPTLGRFFAHFNPGLLLRLRKNDYDIVVVGGMASPTHWLAPFCISKDKVQIMSIESNLNSVQRKSGIGAKIKKLLLSKANAYQVTGKPQIDYINFFDPKAFKKSFVVLPNLIDEDLFSKKVDELKVEKIEIRRKMNIDEHTQIWILPARLSHSKGIIPFLSLLREIKGIRVYLLGDGDLKSNISNYIIKNNLPVFLEGFIQQDEMLKFYAIADLFVLPSLKDPSPLSPIEAIAAGLPILISNRIGNSEDVLEEGINGWAYDPLSKSDKGQRKVSKIAELSRKELFNIGLESKKRYSRTFDNKTCIKDYAKSLNLLR